MVSLGASTSPEVARRPLLLLPIGSCEQHGPHLPLDTDTRVAVAIAERFAAGTRDVVVAPPVAIGASGEHAGFPGTLSIGTAALCTVLVEIGRSADWSAGVVFVNGHGGNVAPVRDAVHLLTGEGRRVLSWSPRILGGDAHAGRTETSLLLAIEPAVVRLSLAEAGNTSPTSVLMPAMRSRGVAAVSPNGVLGDPAGASATEGAHLLGVLVADLAEHVQRWRSE